MSTNNSRIYVKYGTIEVTIEGDDAFVSEQYREIFNDQSNQNTSADKEDHFAPEKLEELPDKPKVSAPSYEKMKGQTQKSPKAKSPKAKSSKESAKSTPSAEPENSKKLSNALGSDFGKWLASLPDNVETRDKILVAAYYNQTMNSDQKFYVRRIRVLLEGQEVSVSNLSGFLDTFEIQKIISKVGDTSRKGYQFTKEGKKYIEDLLK